MLSTRAPKNPDVLSCAKCFYFLTNNHQIQLFAKSSTNLRTLKPIRERYGLSRCNIAHIFFAKKNIAPNILIMLHTFSKCYQYIKNATENITLAQENTQKQQSTPKFPANHPKS